MATTALAQEIGNRIRGLRNAHGWSQRDLARRAGLASKAVISSYELGDRYPSYETLLRLATVFKVTTDYLLLGDDNSSTMDDVSKEVHRGDTYIRIKAGTLTDDQINAILALVTSLTGQKI